MALARFPTLVALSVGFIMWTGNAAHAAATNWVGDSRAAVRLITATDHIAADSTLEAGLEFRFAKGWHGYWRTRETRASHQRWTGLLQKISQALKFPGLPHIASSSRNCRTASTKTT